MTSGIVIDGEFFELKGLEALVDHIASLAAEKAISKLGTSVEPTGAELNYTVAEIAVLVKKSVATITRHIRLGLLKGHKIGKTWLVSEADYLAYKSY